MSQTETKATCNGNGKRKNSSPEKRNVKKQKSKPKFEFGNYNQYYGYRNVNICTDSRITAFNQRKDLFKNRDVLDIGCNIGHVTYIVARDFSPKSVLGIDIDNSLINIARKNRQHYCENPKLTSKGCPANESDPKDAQASSKEDPVSSTKNNNLPDLAQSNPADFNCPLQFPNNISFHHGNYVLDHDNLLELEEPQYDVILCLSVTKWIQLNWGDEGLKRVFKRVYRQLRPGGVFILEAQPWESYKKKKLSAKLRANCRNISFYPHMFKDYLVEIGFHRNETLEIPDHHSKGFQRPIELYHKT